MNTPSTKIRLTRPDGSVVGVVSLSEEKRVELIGGLQQHAMALALEQGIVIEGPWPNIEIVGPAISLTLDRLAQTLEDCIEVVSEGVCNSKEPGKKMSELRAKAYELVERIEENLCEVATAEKLVEVCVTTESLASRQHHLDLET